MGRVSIRDFYILVVEEEEISIQIIITRIITNKKLKILRSELIFLSD
jgi:hypothetical protein